MSRGRPLWLGRIDRYVLGLFASSYATAFLLVVGLYVILEMSQKLDDYLTPFPDGTRVPGMLIARYYLLRLPFLFLEVSPFVTLVAGLFTVGKLVRHSEAVAVLAAGVSAQRLLAPLVVAALALGGAMFGLREGASAQLADRRDRLHDLIDEKRVEQVCADFWLRDERGNLARLGELRPAPLGGGPPEVRGLEVHLVTAASYTLLTADRATWDERADPPVWRLTNGVRHHSRVAGEARTEPLATLEGFQFTPELALTFWRARESALSLSFREAKEMSRRDPDNVVYRTLLQYHVTFPLANVVLILVGLPLLLRHERGRGARTLAGAFGLCVTYFGADFVCRNLGLQGALPAALAAWLPVLVFGSLGVALYDSMRS